MKNIKRLIDGIPLAAYMCDPEGLITHYNSKAAELWGREPKLNDPADRYCGSFKLFSSEGASIEHPACWMARALLERKPFTGREIVVERPDGRRLTALAYANPIFDAGGEMTGAVNMLVDISPQQEAGQLFKAMIGQSPDLVYLRGPDGAISYVSPAVKDSLGYEPGEFASLSWSVVHPDDLPLAKKNYNDLLTGRSALAEMRVRYRRHSGEWRRMALSARKLEPGYPMQGVLIWARDLEAELRAREALAINEQIYRNVVETSWNLVLISDLDGMVVQANPVALATFARPVEDMVGASLSGFAVPGDRAKLAGMVATAAAAGLDDMDPTTRLSLRIPEGAHLFDIRIKKIQAGPSGMLIFRAHDVQPELDAQRQLLTYQRLAVFGQLAAGFAHEVRNPLAAIQSAAQLVRRRLAAGQEAGEQLEVVLRQSARLKLLMDDVLLHAKTAPRQVEAVDPCEALQKATEMAATQFGPGSARVTVSVACEVGRVKVMASEERLSRLLSNLVLNSMQALGEAGGKLSVRARVEGDMAILSVEDDGPGIPPEILPRLFEPFFTTKPTGSGLGLWIAQSLAQELGGAFTVENVEPRGCRFELRLNAAKEA